MKHLWALFVPLFHAACSPLSPVLPPVTWKSVSERLCESSSGTEERGGELLASLTRRWGGGGFVEILCKLCFSVHSCWFATVWKGSKRRSGHFYANRADILNSEMKENTLMPFAAPQVKSHIIKKEWLTRNIAHSSLSISPSPFSRSSVHTSAWALPLRSVTQVILLTLLSSAFSRGSGRAGLDMQSCLPNRALRLVGLREVSKIALTSWRLVCLMCISFQNLSTRRHTHKNCLGFHTVVMLIPFFTHNFHKNPGLVLLLCTAAASI